MLLTCSSCNSRYLVNSGDLKPDGRVVRCAKCAHEWFQGPNLSEEEIISIIDNYDALVVRSATKVTKNIINAGKNLKIIGRAGAGVDNIDLSIAKKNNIIVMNTPGANANATAEHSVALILSLIRNIPYANSSTHKGNWEKKILKV